MQIRALKKLLNISNIKMTKNSDQLLQTLPGEWYAGPVSLKSPGKLAIHFLHHPSYITVVMPGKSLNKLLPLLPMEVSKLLSRHGFSRLEPYFELQTVPEIFTANNRSMIGHLNQIRWEMEYYFDQEILAGPIDLDKVNDNYMDYLFGGKFKPRNFIKPVEILNEFLTNLEKE